MDKIKRFFIKVPKKIVGIILVLIPFLPQTLYALADRLHPIGLHFFLWVFDGYFFYILSLLFLVFLVLFVSAFLFTLSKQNWLKNIAQFLLIMFFISLELFYDFLNEYDYHYPPYMPSVMPIKEY